MSIKYIINGSVLFDCEERTLCSQDQPGPSITLNTPASRCLLLLIERVGTVVSQKEFFDLIWEKNGAYVTANTFYQNITIVRKGLKSTGLQSDIIKTVPKEGLKLVADIEIFTPEVQTPATSEALPESLAAETPSPEAILLTEPVQSTRHIGSSVSETDSLALSAQMSEEQKTKDFITVKTKRLAHTKRWSTWFSFWAIILLFCLLASYTYNQLSYGKHFFSEYYKMGEVNGCLLFSSHFGKEKSIDEFMNFFRSGNINCSPGSVVYLTINRHSLASSILICDKSIENENARCISNIRRVEQ
ncbi:winged helix-turn-helix domain-containing protein [Buttiauxella gaviniae]|uniref:transcriptional regulator n=1 Tax=Buttiauxella gaviniae TaxID=82990 RepID=UPI003BB59673